MRLAGSGCGYPNSLPPYAASKNHKGGLMPPLWFLRSLFYCICGNPEVPCPVQMTNRVVPRLIGFTSFDLR